MADETRTITVDANLIDELLQLQQDINNKKAQRQRLEDDLASLDAKYQLTLGSVDPTIAKLVAATQQSSPDSEVEVSTTTTTKTRKPRVPGTVNPKVVAELKKLFKGKDTVDLDKATKAELAKKFDCPDKDVTASMESIAERQKSGGQGLSSVFKIKS